EFKLPADYYYEISGEYEAQIQATRSILVLSLLSLLGMIAVLYLNFASVNQVLQILIAIPIGFVGGVLGLTLTGQTLSIAALVGFVALGGISIRNGILLMESYVKQGVVLGDSRKAIVAGSLDRLSPVTMTTLTTVFALLPLVFAGKMPGREMLYPVATVILAGLVTSALAEYLLRPGLYWHFRRFNAAGSRQDSHAERS
ncbi:MAG: efflux RND transporter permease subunit, partial [Planctomycetota bacterium]|nr:efflux RND transporter permease subunit [Planctomycetota bacterium]